MTGVPLALIIESNELVRLDLEIAFLYLINIALTLTSKFSLSEHLINKRFIYRRQEIHSILEIYTKTQLVFI